MDDVPALPYGRTLSVKLCGPALHVNKKKPPETEDISHQFRDIGDRCWDTLDYNIFCNALLSVLPKSIQITETKIQERAEKRVA